MNETTMRFGKFKDHPLAAVPSNYLAWLLGSADLFQTTREAVEHELHERQAREYERRLLSDPIVPIDPAEHRQILERVLEAGFLAVAKQTPKEREEARRRLIACRKWALDAVLGRGERM